MRKLSAALCHQRMLHHATLVFMHGFTDSGRIHSRKWLPALQARLEAAERDELARFKEEVESRFAHGFTILAFDFTGRPYKHPQPRPTGPHGQV